MNDKIDGVLKLAIVGASKRNIPIPKIPTLDRLINKTISDHKKSYPKLIVISGGATGVDTMAVHTARAYKLSTLEFKPQIQQWDDKEGQMGFKSRNLKIATECDKLVNIVVKEAGSYCYHCDEMGHIKSGGCWTMKKAEEMMKPVEQFTI